MSETKLFGGNPTADLLEQGCRVGHPGVLIRLQISEGVDSADADLGQSRIIDERPSAHRNHT